MKIALFGATGQTGIECLKQALRAGHTVVASARTPSKLDPYEDKNLQVIEGDVLNPEHPHQVVKDCDIVISLFGHVKDSPADVQTRGTLHIVKAMEKAGISRIISLSGGGLRYEKDQPKIMDKLIKGIMGIVARKILSDAENHAKVLKASGLEWCIVRGPQLKNGPAKGHYNVTWVGVNSGIEINRADLAAFILKEAEMPDYSYSMPFVTY